MGPRLLMLVVLVGSTALASRCSQYSSAAQCADASECAWCVGANASGSCATNGTAAAADRVQSVAPLSVSGTSLVFNGAPVFLSGANLAWIDYGDDFGNNQTNGKICALRSYVRNVSAVGGNTLRVWLFVDGHAIPAFDSDGSVVGTDAANSLTRELVQLARYAASRNVLLNLCLWNGAVKPPPAVRGLLDDEAKLQSFFDNALAPLVRALKDEPGVGAWEVMNEPEGSVLIASDAADACFDTKDVLAGSGAGWTGSGVPMRTLQAFVNKHAAAIHAADARALVTLGSWSQYAMTDAPSLPGAKRFFNYWKDECLEAAGGVSAANGGALDFYQVHTYATPSGAFAPSSPMALPSASAYALRKPLVIGEFSAAKCTHPARSVESLYAHALAGGYAGAWDWVLQGSDGNDDAATCARGMRSIASSPKVKVAIGGAPPPDTCACSDVAPPGQYTCAQQAGWGKCSSSFMKGFCCRSCHACTGCS